MIFDAPNNNHLWAGLMVEELVRAGVHAFFLAPGSRSTPLTTAVAAHPRARAVVHFDERGTAFAALGCARATGRPAAWVTTSGTAVANGLPAVVEAATDGVPLLLITADRPPELRDTGANQAIDQVKLFGGYVRWQVDLPAPDASMDPAMVLTTVDQAVYRARRMPSGPVHLNCMFREPLAPDGGGVGEVQGLERLRPWFASERPYTAYEQSMPRLAPGRIEAQWEALRGVERGLVVAGRLGADADGGAVAALAEALGWPLLADVGSQVRLGGQGSNQIFHFDHLLASERFRRDHVPEAALHFGRRSTSKRLMAFLEHHRPGHYLVVDDLPSRFDPAHQVTARAEAGVQAYCGAFLAAMGGTGREPKRPSWLQKWRDAGRRAASALDHFFSAAGDLTEPLVARSVSALIPEAHGLVLAASMPVRDMDMYAVYDGARVHVACNRGASGIDGTVATAAGFAHGRQTPVTLVIGDLALLHDLNGLALLRGAPVVAVVLNNDGGGIFSFLPISRHRDVFEPYFGTPHGFRFEDAARMFGLAYAHPDTPEGFRNAYRAACAAGGAALIEVTTDRAANEVLHRELLGVVTDTL